MMVVKTYPFDVVDFLRDDEDIAGYLTEMMALDDMKLTERAVCTVERAKALPVDGGLDLAARLYRAAHSVGLKISTAPLDLASDSRAGKAA